MRCFTFALLGLGLLIQSSALAADKSTAAATAVVLNENAALQYWQAFAQMPTLDKEQEKIVAEWRTVSLDDPAVKKLVDDSRSSMKFLHRATQLTECDWGLDYNEGISLMLPHIARSRDLARLAALTARYDFEQGNKQALSHNATGMMVLARRIGEDPFLICLAVQYGLEEMTVDLVAPYVPKINVPYAKAVEMFNSMPASATLHECILAEKKLMAASIMKELEDAEKRRPGGWRELWDNLLKGSDVPKELREVKSLDELNKLVTDFFATYDDFGAMADLPKSEFDAKYSDFAKRLKSTNPISALLLPTLDKLANKQFRNQARMSMLLVGIAVTEGGQEKLKDIRDPFGDGPFVYRELDGGYELQSKLVVDGKPVTLKIGQPKK